MLPAGACDLPARVIEVQRERYELVCPRGFVHGRLKKGIYYDGEEDFPTVGDFVLIQYNSVGDSLVVKTLPRKSVLTRLNPTDGQGGQAIAANVDVCFVLTSMNYDFNLARLERYVSCVKQSGAKPVIVLTKADLAPKPEDYVIAVKRVFNNIDISVISTVTGEGIDTIKDYLIRGTTVVFLGSSGVGKSSLVNALKNEQAMVVRSIREDDGKGRHTTTHRQLFLLDCGTMVIDTPGMRELGMWTADSGIFEAFEDVETILLRGCRFSDCRHDKEPDCAINAAIDDGELTLMRWQNYLRLKREAEYAANYAEAHKEKTNKIKTYVKNVRQMQKLDKKSRWLDD